jgi:surfactin synthase thioesterase subunit/glycosyltransferase involved in cell wall biosynthesis
MRLLLTSNASYDPPRGGSTRSNLAWLRQLAAAGHECHVICGSTGGDTATERDGIRIEAYRDLARRTEILHAAIMRIIPDWVLVTSEDVGHTLLREAAHAAPGRLIFLAHTPQWFPFGPESWHPDPAAAALVRGARQVIAIGHHMAGYIQQHLGVKPAVVHPPIYGSLPYPKFGRFADGYVLMINPSEVKGVRIFAALAERFPDLPFAALVGWGTTRSDRDLLARHPNVQSLGAVDSIDEVLSRARVLLMPSLWYEGFGLIAMEAMLRGVPVIAGDSGGLEEAKAGTGYVIPVRPIVRYLPEFDENGMPKAVAPEQDVEPWIAALHTLTSDENAYWAEAARSRERAESFVSQLRPDGLERALESLHPPPLRILLAHNSLYFPSHGGGDKSNRILMELLAAHGHDVRVVARIEHFGEESHTRLLRDLASRGVSVDSADGGVVRFRHKGVEVHTLTANPRIRSYFEGQVASFDPQIVVTSTDDPAQLLFEIAAQSEKARVVYLVRATIAAPFGPDASSPNPRRAAALRRADGIATVSEYVARYVREHSGMDAVHIPISLPDPGPFPLLGRFDNPYVTMVNPCAVKGIAVFLGLAEQMPGVQFAAVPTWGATSEDLAALRRLPNVTLMPASDDIDRILEVTRVLLVPSVWAEARSRIVLEAMERGVPVMAGNLGGLPEAKLGVPYILPVNPIRRYLPSVDENMVPVADVPPQDVGPWAEALRRLVTDQAHWDEISGISRRAALEYGDRATVWPFEAFLWSLLDKPVKRVEASNPEASAADLLSPEKRKLLAIRLKKRAAQPRYLWFPGIEESGSGKLRLFCFPHAGGGASAYARWRAALSDIAVCPVRLPGREARLREDAFEDMTKLVSALAGAIDHWLGEPFAFFGHSMGAGIAFELARELRRRGKPLPQALIVSGARAPQLRAGWTAPAHPSDAELVDRLRQLEGIPPDLLDNPEALRLALPALRSDVRLYTDYQYSPDPPLAVPIAACAGISDPNVPPDQVEAWKEQTSAAFLFHLFEGGHFFLHSSQAEFLRQLTSALAALAPAWSGAHPR